MAFTITFTPTGMTTAKYDEVMRRLDAAGASAPAGRHYHTCFGSPEGLRVVDVWETMDHFEKFGGTLVPILTSLGIEVGAPDVQPQHNEVRG
jgi:hypothetical protein